MPNPAPFAERYALSSWLYATEPLDVVLRTIAEGGFKWVELWADCGHLDPRLRPDGRHIRRLMREYGLHAHAIHAPFSGLSLGLPNRDLVKTWIEVVGASLDLSAEVESGIAVVHVSSHALDLHSDEDYDGSALIIREFVHDLLARAARVGVKLALENILAVPRRRRVGQTLQELARLFPEPEVGFCLDVGHAAIAKADLRAEIAASEQRLLTTHLSNNDGVTDLHRLPSTGVIDWPALKKLFTDFGYRGRHVLEIDGRSTLNPIGEVSTFAGEGP